MKNEKLWQLLLVLALIVIVSSFFTRHLTSSGTLYDYAQENPEIAYANKKTELEESTEAESIEGTDETGMTDETATPTEADTSGANNIVTTDISETETLCSYPTADDMNSSAHPERVTYADGFFYEPITPEIEARIRGISYPEDDTDIEVSLSDLSYVGVLYNDFEGRKMH